MSEFNRKSFDAGKSGGSSPVSSVPGQPANMKDREAFWQGRAQARWARPSVSTNSPSYTAPSSGAGFSGSGISSTGKGGAGIVIVLIVVAIFALDGPNDKKTPPAESQPAQGIEQAQDQAQSPAQEPPWEWHAPASSPTQTTQRLDQPASTGDEQSGRKPLKSAYEAIPDAAPSTPPPGPTQAEALEPAEPAVPTGAFTARHQGFGGRWGQLTLTKDSIEFDSKTDHYNFPIDSIAVPDENGFILRSGKRYHFEIDQRPKAFAAALFSDWFEKAVSRDNLLRIRDSHQ